MDEDSREAIHGAVIDLLGEMCERNGVDHEDVVSILFTATDDLHAAFPAAGARQMGFGDVPLLCAQEINVDGALQRVVRILVHVETDLPKAQIQHVYLRGAEVLRQDLIQ